METVVKLNKDGLTSQIIATSLQLEAKMDDYLHSLFTGEAKSNADIGLNKALDEFKKSVYCDPKKNFPDKVYKAIMARIAKENKNDISLNLSITDNEADTIRKISNYISAILDTNDETIRVDETIYKISNPFGSKSGIIKVSVNGTDYTLFLKNDNNAQKALKNFISELNDYARDYRHNVYAAIIEDGASTFVDSWIKALKSNDYKVASDVVSTFKTAIDFEEDSQTSPCVIDTEIINLLKGTSPCVIDTEIINLLKGNLDELTILKLIKKLTEKIFPKNNKEIKDITNSFNVLEEKKHTLVHYIENNNVSSESLIKSSAYKNFVKAFNDLETIIGESKISFDSIVAEYNIYEFIDVTNADIFENNAIINGTDDADTIKSTGTNVTINGNGENDSITTTSSKALVNGGTGNDTILSNGFNSKIYGNEGNDIIYVEGKQTSVNGGSGSDTIIVNNSDITVNGGGNFDGLPVIDTIIISSDSEDVVINDFDKDDILNLSAYNASDLSAGKYQTTSLEIYSRKTYKTIAILSDVTSGTNENILCKNDNGEVISVSLNWILENTPFIINPYDTLNSYDSLKPSQIITIPINDSINNSRDNVMITALSGNHSIENTGNNVTISGGTDKDKVTNLGDNVVIEGNSGNDIISNGEESFSTSQPTKGGDNVVINGGAGLDLIYNYGGLNVQLNGAEGADTLYNSGSNTTITGGDGDDSINNENASEVTISGGNGKDTISNIGENVSIDGGDGIDFIYNGNYSISGGSNVSISGGEDNDYISNWDGSKLSISGGAGNDYIFNNGTNVTMLGDAGDDTITNRGTNSTIYSGDGKDSIENRGNYTSIDMGEGDNRIWNMGTNTTIHSGTGDDTVHNGGAESHDAEDVKIDTGAGNDSIHNIRDNVTIDAGADNDLIYNDGDNVFVVGNTGDDTIRSELSHNVTINSGDGNDSINNNSSETTIDAGDGDDNITINASDVLIDAGAGKDSIFLSNAYRGTVNSSTGNDYIETYGRSAFIKINTGDGDDSIKNTASETTIISGTGDDSIDNDGSNVTIDTGDGNDIIYNDDENVSISSGNGNDTIIAFTGDHTTINAGAGNDSIYLGSSRLERQTVIQYNSGDGHDTIHQFYLTSTLNITGEAYSTQRSGNDIIVRVGNGSITLKDIQGFTPNIQNTFNGDDTQSGGDDTQSGGDDTQSGGNDTQSGGDDTQSGGDDTQSGGNDTQSGGNDTQSGGNDTQSGGDDTQSGGNDTQSGGDDTQSGGDDTQSGGQDQTDTVRIVKNIVGLDLNYLDKVVVTDLDSLDDLIDERTVWLNFSSDSGDGFQNIDLSKSDYRQVISLEGGNQKVTFNDTDRNVVIVGKNATGFKNIIFGNGDDLGIFLSPKAYIKTTVGSGNDSIITDNNARVHADMTNADNAQIIPYSGRVILDNYDHESQAEIVLPEVTDITSAVKDNSIQLVGNEIRFDSSTVKIKNSATGSTLVNLATENGDSQKVGFTGLNGGSLDTSKLDGDFLLKGNYGENPSNRGSKITSGKGNDTILAGSGDSVNGGDGANQIYLTPKELRQNEGTTVIFTDKGTYTVHGFNSGFNDTSDTLLFDANDAVDLKFDGTNLSLKTDNGAQGVLTDLADDVSFVTLFVADEDKRDKLAVAKKDATITVDDKNFARMYYGDNSGVDFSNTTKDLFVELDNDETLLFDGITQVTAGSGQNTLIGSDNAEILISGNGYNSIYGGGGNDSLVGKGGSADKDGRTTFFFFAGDGRDVISNFEFLTPQNRHEGIDDKIDVGDSDVNNAYVSGDNLIIEFDQDSYLVLENARGKDFRINNLIAKVDKNIAYDGNANCYVADGGTSLKVESTVSSAEIWLDNSHDTLFLGTPIRTLDASEVKGNTSLVGNEYDNTIIAGQGDASLWGGDSASDDVLIGGNSRNTFFYCNGNGRDTIQGINDGDSVILADISLDQITSTEIAANSVFINFIDGGSLRIEGNVDVTYQLADGSKYSANHEQLEWIDK